MNLYSNYALIVAGSIFGIISLMHLWRLVYSTPIVIAEKKVPMWISVIGFVFSLLLSIWMFIASSFFILHGDQMSLTLESSVFENGSSIPQKYTCDGENISPPLSWKDEPANTKSFVLIVDDPDAPAGVWDHWIVFNIPYTIHELAENLDSLANSIRFGKNSWGKSTYGGPCPPKGEHRYFFKLYALDALLNLPENATKSQIETAMQGHILADTKLIGRYKNKES